MNDQKVKITKVISEPDDSHDPEVLPMFRVEFIDPAAGLNWLSDLEVWRDELSEQPVS